MKLHRIKEIIFEEVSSILEASITKNFTKAVEALQKIQLAQQKLRKAFVAEKDPKKKEKLKADLIKIHKSVQKAELEFNQAIKNAGLPSIDSIGANAQGVNPRDVASAMAKGGNYLYTDDLVFGFKGKM